MDLNEEMKFLRKFKNKSGGGSGGVVGLVWWFRVDVNAMLEIGGCGVWGM